MATPTALLLVTRPGVAPALLETAIARAHRDHEQLHVVIPAVIPPTLPISAMPAGLAERVDSLRRTAIEAFAQLQARGRIDVVPSRDARSALLAAVAEVPDRVLLVGAPGRSLRRAAQRLTAVTVVAETDRDAPLRVGRSYSELLETCRRTLRPMSFRSRDQTRGLPTTEERGLPRPGQALAPYAVIVAAAGVFLLGRALPLRSGVAFAAAAALAGAAAAGWTWVQRARLRDMADRFIAAGEGTAPPAAVLEERRAELVSRRERRTLAAALRRAITPTQPSWLSTQVPVHRPAVQAERARLERVAALLADTDMPVPARGVARTHVLLTNPASPLYRGAAGELQRQLTQTLFELERGE